MFACSRAAAARLPSYGCCYARHPQDLYVSTEYLSPGDRVLIIDDFLAGGRTADAMIRLCRMANANVVGGGFLIEKVSNRQMRHPVAPCHLLRITAGPRDSRPAPVPMFPVKDHGPRSCLQAPCNPPSQVNDAGRAFLSGYQIPLESIALVSIDDGTISIVEQEERPPTTGTAQSSVDVSALSNFDLLEDGDDYDDFDTRGMRAERI